MPHLDQYEEAGLADEDDEDYDEEAELQARFAAEAEMQDRDKVREYGWAKTRSHAPESLG
jgi:hypothetical protein